MTAQETWSRSDPERSGDAAGGHAPESDSHPTAPSGRSPAPSGRASAATGRPSGTGGRDELRAGLDQLTALAEGLGEQPGLGAANRERLRSLRREIERLATLLAEESTGADQPSPAPAIRLDQVLRELVAQESGSVSTGIECVASPVSASVSGTGLWRALSNLLDNAVRAAGPAGRVQLRVRREGPAAVIEVDDSGPGFGLAAGGLAQLGLGIVQDFVAGYDGDLALSAGKLGGCCVRLTLPAVLDDEQGEPERSER